MANLKAADESPEDFEARFRSYFLEAERTLSIPEGFVTDLIKADDWSFVIRLHALVELALFQLLASRLPKASHEWIETHNIGGRTGKLALARELEVLSRSEYSLVQKLTELRNAYTHNLRMVGVPLDAHFKTKGEQELKIWLGLAQEFVTLVGTPDSRSSSGHDWLVRNAPKVALFMSAWPLVERANRQASPTH